MLLATGMRRRTVKTVVKMDVILVRITFMISIILARYRIKRELTGSGVTGMAERCIKCGQEDAFTMVGRRMCADCTEKENRRRRQLYAIAPEKYLTTHEVWKQKQIADGLCTRCVKPAEPGRKMCAKHLAYYRRMNASARHRDGDSFRNLSLDGVCYQCGAPAESGYKLCEYHHRRSRETLVAARASLAGKDHPWNRDNRIIFQKKNG